MLPIAASVLDLEWDANDPDHRLMVVGVGGKAWETPNGTIPQAALSTITGDETAKVVFTKADVRYLEERGVVVGGDIIDVQTMAWTIDETTPLDLDWCIKRYLGFNPDKRLSRKAGTVLFRCDDGTEVPMGEAPMDQLLAYNERDLVGTWELKNKLTKMLRERGQYDYWEKMQQPFTRVLVDMEINGLPIDVPATMELGAELASSVQGHEANLRLGLNLPAEFNFASRDQVAKLLFTKEFTLPSRIAVGREDMAKLREGEWVDAIPKSFDITKLGRDYVHGEYELKGLGLKPKTRAPKCQAQECGHKSRADCEPSVSSKTLKVEHGTIGAVKVLTDLRLESKVGQYLESWLTNNVDGRLHTHFKQTGTATGRLSSSDPVNLQNIPARGELGKKVRGLFRPAPGNLFINGDYSQIEPRLMAHFSGDKALLEVFNEGLDLYTVTMFAILGREFDKDSAERQLVKTCFLALGYGAGPRKIWATLAEQGFHFSLEKVTEIHNRLTELYSGFWLWKDEVIAQAKERGYVETLAGHRRHLSFYGEGGWKAERQAVNSIIQGSAADVVQTTMIEVYHAFPQWSLVCQVHDEIMLEAHERLITDARVASFQRIAEAAYASELTVPLVFEPKVIESWAGK